MNIIYLLHKTLDSIQVFRNGLKHLRPKYFLGLCDIILKKAQTVEGTCNEHRGVEKCHLSDKCQEWNFLFHEWNIVQQKHPTKALAKTNVSAQISSAVNSKALKEKDNVEAQKVLLPSGQKAFGRNRLRCSISVPNSDE